MPENETSLLEQVIALYEAGQLGRAVALAGQCEQPDAILLHLVAACHLGLGELEQACACWRRVVRMQPGHAEAWNGLGVVLAGLRRDEQAEWAYREALRHHPDYASAHYNLAVLLRQTNRLPESEAAYRQALCVRPDYVDCWNNLGILLKEQRRFDEAEAVCREALRIEPVHAGAWYNLGVLLVAMGRFDEAEAAYRQALLCQPEHADAQWNLALLHLSAGRFAAAWPLYAARMQPNHSGREAMKTVPCDLPFPMWRGEDVAGKALLVMPEQGFGDQIQFCRYLPLVKAMGVRQLTLVCRAPLVPLLATLEGVDQVLELESLHELPRHDYWVFMLSLPLWVGRRCDDCIPVAMPYLHPLAGRLAHWAGLLPARGFRVGLSWKGNPGFTHDVSRSLPGLEVLAPLWAVPGVFFVSLQKGNGEAEGENPPPGQPLLHVGGMIRDFADTAAIVAQLDLVICSDSAIVHLVGALKKPCWLMLPFEEPDYRWMRDRTDSPWYPGTLRLFRQTQAGDWAGVVRRMQGELFHRRNKEGMDGSEKHNF